jgi:hypothetical protein
MSSRLLRRSVWQKFTGVPEVLAPFIIRAIAFVESTKYIARKLILLHDTVSSDTFSLGRIAVKRQILVCFDPALFLSNLKSVSKNIVLNNLRVATILKGSLENDCQ